MYFTHRRLSNSLPKLRGDNDRVMSGLSWVHGDLAQIVTKNNKEKTESTHERVNEYVKTQREAIQTAYDVNVITHDEALTDFHFDR